MPFQAHYQLPCLRLLALLLTAALLPACSSLGPDWRLEKQTDGINYFVRQSHHPSLPEFKASIRIDASIPEVMQVVTDFSHFPDWVYRCEETKVIALVGYTDAYVYQVNSLPIITDRDIILHGQTQRSEDGKQMQIQLIAEPDYCINNDDEDCASIIKSPYVRVRSASGLFTLIAVSSDTTEVTWQQFLDPGGAIPHWLFRLMLSQVPVQSLKNLKALVEKNGAKNNVSG